MRGLRPVPTAPPFRSHADPACVGPWQSPHSVLGLSGDPSTCWESGDFEQSWKEWHEGKHGAEHGQERNTAQRSPPPPKKTLTLETRLGQLTCKSLLCLHTQTSAEQGESRGFGA